LWRWQGPIEVGDGLAFAFVQPGLDLMNQHCPGPAVLDDLLGIPEAPDGVIQFGQELEVMPPWDFSNGLWEIFAVQSSNPNPLSPGARLWPSRYPNRAG
jgi:hypothetical protein